MGAVFRPKDLRRGIREAVRRALSDLSPGEVEDVLAIIDSKGADAQKNLEGIVGRERARKLIEDLTGS